MEKEKHYSLVIQTMRQMYAKKKITIEQVKNAYLGGHITCDEYEFIIQKGQVSK